MFAQAILALISRAFKKTPDLTVMVVKILFNRVFGLFLKVDSLTSAYELFIAKWFDTVIIETPN